MTKYILGLLLCIGISSCVEIPNQFSKLPPGSWKGVLKLDHEAVSLTKKVEEVEYKKEFDYSGELPFLFEVVYTSKEEFYVEIINGKERIKVTDIHFGTDLKTAKDTIILNFPVYDSYIKGLYEDGVIEGNWYVNYKEDYAIPFIARHGKNKRFESFGKSATSDLSGNWKVTFEPGTEDAYPAIGEFVQKGNLLSGTFLTETGDYRYLDGIVRNNKAYLSCFDGSHAFLFEAKQLEDESLVGSFRSGSHYKSNWIATKTDDPEIGDPFQLTEYIASNKKLDFAFENENSQLISINDKEYQDKVKLVMIMGTWCPNCRDEMVYIQDYLKNNPSDQIEVIAVGFERYKDVGKCKEVLQRYKETMNIDFEVLYGGSSRKSDASEKFPMLNKIISYPTLLMVDKNNQVRKIHTGFNGPATSKFKAFDQEFKSIMTTLINE